MKYRGVLNFDFTGKSDSNQRDRLKLALTQSGWLHIETSAFVIETDDLAKVWRGIELAAKQAASIGQLSALTFHIQGAEDFTRSLPPTSDLNPEKALRGVLQRPLPTPRPG